MVVLYIKPIHLPWIQSITLLILLSLSRTTYTRANVHYGYQSGFATLQESLNDDTNTQSINDDSFASSMYYNPETNLLYVTGGTYSRYWDGVDLRPNEDAAHMAQSDCFLGIFHVPVADTDATGDEDMTRLYAQLFGQKNIPEVCSSMTVVPNNDGDGAKVIVLGHTEENGILTSLRGFGNPKSEVYGFLLEEEVSWNKLQGEKTRINGKGRGGHLMNDDDASVEYPVAIATSTYDEPGNIYVATMSSVLATTKKLDDSIHQDLSAAAGIIHVDYGADFRIAIQKKVSKSEEEMAYTASERSSLPKANANEEGGVVETIKTEWTRYFSIPPTTDDESVMDVQVSDLLYIPRSDNDVLVFVGSAQGDGDDFGGEGTGTGDFDGFVTKLDPTTGDRASSSQPSIRIGVPKSDDFIRGACFEQGSDNVDSLYVVGETSGSLDTVIASPRNDDDTSRHAFIAKINLINMELSWARQIGGVLGKDVLSYGCVVFGDRVFMGGTVKDGDTIQPFETTTSNNTVSAGEDDIFVASFNSAVGETQFVKQFGTLANDSIAKGGGITVDKNGDVIVLGNTQGSIMRYRGDGDDLYDIFMLSIDKEDGSMRTIFQYTDPPEIEKQKWPSFGPGEFFAVFAAISVMASILYAGRKILNVGGRRNEHEDAIVFVENFRDKDVGIHIRQSATGGIHGIYHNKKGTLPQGQTDASFTLGDSIEQSINHFHLADDEHRPLSQTINNSQTSSSWNHSKRSSPTSGILYSRSRPSKSYVTPKFDNDDDDWDKTLV